jgi:hypothetical protein
LNGGDSIYPNYSKTIEESKSDLGNEKGDRHRKCGFGVGLAFVHLRFISISFRKKRTDTFCCDGIMEYWENGKMERQSVNGLQVTSCRLWKIGIVKKWNVGMMEEWKSYKI